jgi:hypothetical protein
MKKKKKKRLKVEWIFFCIVNECEQSRAEPFAYVICVNELFFKAFLSFSVDDNAIKWSEYKKKWQLTGQ